eukprot:3860565-Lingulodinium_polyedra.AAC.1
MEDVEQALDARFATDLQAHQRRQSEQLAQQLAAQVAMQQALKQAAAPGGLPVQAMASQAAQT